MAFFTPPQLLALYRGAVRPCMEYASHIWGGFTHTTLLEKVKPRAFRLINSLSLLLTLSNLFLSVELLRHSLYTIAITIDTALLNSLVAYLLH